MIDKIIVSRRSIRRFKPEMPSRETILRLIEAATAAPSAGNSQPWQFIAVTDKNVVASLAEAVQAAMKRIERAAEVPWRNNAVSYGDSFSCFRNAPAVIVALHRTVNALSHIAGNGASSDERSAIVELERLSAVISVAMALQNILLTAHDMGLGATCMTGPLVAARELQKILAVRSPWEITAFVAIGIPDETPIKPPRKPVNAVLRWIE